MGRCGAHDDAMQIIVFSTEHYSMVIFEPATTHTQKKQKNFSSVLFLALNYLIAIHGLLTILACFVSFHVHVHVAANNLKRDVRLPYIASLSVKHTLEPLFPAAEH